MSDIGMDILRESTSFGVKDGREGRSRLPLWKPATVVRVGLTETIAEVSIDDDPDITGGGDDVEFGGVLGAQIIYPTSLRAGDRVMVVFQPPHGALVVGRFGGDFEDWRVIGDEGNPSFNTGWANTASTDTLFTDSSSVGQFRRLGRYVELRGRVQRVSGASDLIFTLPDDYWPSNRLFLPVITGVGTFTFSTLTITLAGQVQALAGADVDEPGGSIFFDGIMYSVDGTLDEG